MSEYTQWEQAVTEQVADLESITYSDAAGIVEAQDSALQQAWGQGLDPKQAADKILAAAS